MTPDKHVQAEKLFEEALRRPSEQWSAFLDSAGADAETRSLVESLLATHHEAPTLDWSPAPNDPRARLGGGPEAFVGRRIGGYRITRHIAAGGMGSVYEAIQDLPRRTIALKIMKRGFNLKRFEYESQTLARLRHPAIAHVYEAGTHDDAAGPIAWFAMEYIPNARSITSYAQAWELSTPERVELFLKVCDAVEHAHVKGVTHCDLKPGNILVESSGRLKVIDFGVARAIDTDVALEERAGRPLGTPAYMSPEQWAADPHDLDIRTDVYALGVVLHELLWDHVPPGPPEAGEAPPPRPAGAGDHPDLQAIVVKAHQRRRDLRYRSVAELSDALEKWLTDQARRAESIAASVSRRRSVQTTVGTLAFIAVAVMALTAGILLPRTGGEPDTGSPSATNNDADEPMVATVVASDRTVAVPSNSLEHPWQHAVSVKLFAEWYDATKPFDEVDRPDRPGPDDYFRLAIRAGQPGQIYLFQIRPDGEVVLQPGVADERECPPHAFTGGRSPQWLGTYHTAGPPGHYCLVAMLAEGSVPELCARLAASLSFEKGYAFAGKDAWPQTDSRVAQAIERLLGDETLGERILGYGLFPYPVNP